MTTASGSSPVALMIESRSAGQRDDSATLAGHMASMARGTPTNMLTAAQQVPPSQVRLLAFE